MEITALIPRPSNTGNKSQWVVEFEKELEEVETSGPSIPVIFSMANAFLASDQQFYIPSVISFGPYHFERILKISSMEPHKKEAVLRMQQRMHGKSMQSIVETEILPMDKRIRDFYDKGLSCSAIDLAWMVTRDFCFMFEFMLNYLRTRAEGKDFHNDCVVEGRYDAVLSSTISTPTWKNIWYDLRLFENQIPLFVLKHLLAIAYSKSYTEKILGDILSRAAPYNINLVFQWGMARPYKEEKTLHFLEVMYYRHVGWNLAGYNLEAYSVNDRRSLNFGWIKSFFSCWWCPRWMRGRGESLRHFFSLFAHFTSHILPQCSRSWCLSTTGVEEHVEPFRLKLPSAAELQKKGVNLCAVTSMNSSIKQNRQCIRWVRFEEKTSTLYLPEVRIDDLRHTLLRNFIALENTSRKYRPAPITSFAFFMDELVDSEDDVAVLREANIIKNFFGSNKEAAECFNTLTNRYTSSVGCKPIEVQDPLEGIQIYLFCQAMVSCWLCCSYAAPANDSAPGFLSVLHLQSQNIGRTLTNGGLPLL